MHKTIIKLASLLTGALVLVAGLLASGCDQHYIEMYAQAPQLISAAHISTVTNDLSVCPANSNCYYQPDRSLHLAPAQSMHTMLHEACHAWQGRNLAASDIALAEWKSTPEGIDFHGTLEQAADVCASWYMHDAQPRGVYIKSVDPDWQRWAVRWLP